MKKFFSLLFALTLIVSPFVLAQDADDVPSADDVAAAPEVYSYTAPGIPPMVYYYAAGLIVFFILYFVVTKVVKNKGNAFKSNQFAAIDQKSPAEKQALLDSLFGEEGLLHPFQAEMKGEKIIGLRQCFPYKTLGSAAKDAAKTAGKQVLWSMVGVKATYIDVGRYYLVLTDKNLHYLAFDKHHELAVNEVFPLSQLMNITLKKATAKDLMVHSGASGGEVLEFEFNGEKVHFVYRIQNVDFPNVELKELQKLLTDNYEAFLYVEMMFQKKLEEKAGTTFEE
ncbi:MAG: hypothetical protein LBD11_01980 [Candidatus Peribacteria bacterium]|jgi:hypothetical protein|nr:hypothetical protein [Candidatus Peribacteria bacterium]